MDLIISIIKIIRAFFHKVRDDHISAFSAQTSFFVFVSFFPFFIFLLSLIQFLPVTETSLIETIETILPSTIQPLIISTIKEAFSKSTGAVISLSVISALWTSSKAMLSIVKGLNAVYGIKETRNYIRLRVLSTFYTLIFAIIITVSIAILVFGNQLFAWVINKFPSLEDVAFLVISARTLVSLLLLIIFFTLFYVFIPNRKIKFYKEAPGALFSALCWIGFSYLYSYYIDNFSNATNMYGNLTTIVLFLLWFYFCMYILFIGGEINVVLFSGDIVYYFKEMIKHRKNSQHKNRLSIHNTCVTYQIEHTEKITDLIHTAKNKISDTVSYDTFTPNVHKDLSDNIHSPSDNVNKNFYHRPASYSNRGNR